MLSLWNLVYILYTWALLNLDAKSSTEIPDLYLDSYTWVVLDIFKSIPITEFGISFKFLVN